METHMEIIWPPVQGSSLQLCTSTSSGHSSPPWAASLATDRTLAELRKMRKKWNILFLKYGINLRKKLDISLEDIQHFSQLLGLVATHDSKQVLHSLQLVILQSTVD